MIYVYGHTFYDFKGEEWGQITNPYSTTRDNAYIASISNNAASIIMETK